MTVVPYQYQAITHRLGYAEDVIKTKSGAESRIQTLGAPREYLDITYILDDEQARQVRDWLLLGPGNTFEIPLRHEALLVTVAVSGTGITANATYADWVAAGQRVMVENQAGEHYESSIASVGPIVLDDGPSGGTYAANLTRIMPLVPVILEDGQGIARHRVNAGEWHLTGKVNRFATTFGTGASLTTFDSIPVLDRRPAGEGVAPEQFPVGLEPLDFGGVVEQRWPRSVGDIKRDHLFHIRGDAERQWWKKFHHTLLGRQGVFLFPTWRDDLHANATPAHGSTTLVLTDLTVFPYDDLWTASAAHRRLQILTEDGVVHYHRVTAVGGGGASLTITPAFSNAGGSPIERISFLEQCRLESEEFVWQHLVGGQARLPLSARVIQSGVDGAIATYDQAAVSIASSRPIELYELVVGATTMRRTSYSSDVSYGGHTWTAVPSMRSSIACVDVGKDGTKELEVSVSLPVSDAFVLATAFDIPPSGMSCVITRLEPVPNAARELWAGAISNIAIEKHEAKLRVPNVLDSAFSQAIPKLRFQRLCQHALYSAATLYTPGCQVVRTDFDQATTVSSVNGRTIVVGGVGGNPDSWFRLGEIVRDSDGERRWILSQVGTTLLINAPFRTLAGTNPVTLYAGCDGKVKTCRDKFNNIVNFLGMPKIPKKNPYQDGLK